MPIFVASSLATALHNHCTLTTYDLKFSPNTMLTNTAVFVYSLLPLKYSSSSIKFFFSISAQPSMQGRSGSKCKEGVVVIKAKCFLPPKEFDCEGWESVLSNKSWNQRFWSLFSNICCYTKPFPNVLSWVLFCFPLTISSTLGWHPVLWLQRPLIIIETRISLLLLSLPSSDFWKWPTAHWCSVPLSSGHFFLYMFNIG